MRSSISDGWEFEDVLNHSFYSVYIIHKLTLKHIIKTLCISSILPLEVIVMAQGSAAKHQYSTLRDTKSDLETDILEAKLSMATKAPICSQNAKVARSFTSAELRQPRTMLSAIFAVFILISVMYSSRDIFLGHHWTTSAVSIRSLPTVTRAAAASLLEVFQVSIPVLTTTPDGVLEVTDGSSNASKFVVGGTPQPCHETLVVHSFGYSYGQPFVGEYSPPGCSFNRVSWNLTVTSRGRQFDRLGIVYLVCSIFVILLTGLLSHVRVILRCFERAPLSQRRMVSSGHISR
nr:hypothetical protein CFP56_16553 [Quercus suber]